MADNTPQQPERPQEGIESWRELEYSGCLYCDKPWDHHINTADGSIFMCLDCYERRFGGNASTSGDGSK